MTCYLANRPAAAAAAHSQNKDTRNSQPTGKIRILAPATLPPCAPSLETANNKKQPSGGVFYKIIPVVIPKGVEPLIFWMRTRRPGPLDDGTTEKYFNKKSLLLQMLVSVAGPPPLSQLLKHWKNSIIYKTNREQERI